MTSLATLLALVAFGPIQTMAREPSGHSGGGRSGGQQNMGQQSGSTGARYQASPNAARTSNAGTREYQGAGAQGNRQFAGGAGVAAGPDSWRYRSDNGRWWYWTPQNRWMWYGDNGQWMDYSADNYSYATPYAVARPVEANFSGGPITISNPATNTVTLNYTLDGTAYTIPPGYNQDVREDRAWVIQFSRGANLDQAQYGLQSGRYTFTATDQGWELYRSELR
ncbi:MAG: hypothetical protein ABSG68_13530 [Thermoguttaceae bacterium]|jgi:hypothetical protein